MTETTQQLARKLADHPRFRWLRGTRGLRWAPGHMDHLREEFSSNGETDDRPALFGSVPDLDDPATIGCVEAQVRALAPRRRFVLYEPDGRWILQLQSLECVVLWATGSTTRGAVWAAAFLDVALMDFVASPDVLAKSASGK